MNMRKRVRELEDAMISTCDVAQHVTRDVKNLSTSIGEWSVQCFVTQLENSQNKPNLLLLHGTMSSSLFFMSMFGKLCSTFNVYAIDVPGFGVSTAPPRLANLPPHLAMDAYVELLNEWLKSMKLGKVFVAGHSFGAYIGAAFAYARPELVSQLLILDCPGLFPFLGDYGAYWGSLFKSRQPQQTCRFFSSAGYFMVNQCSSSIEAKYSYAVLALPKGYGDRVLANHISVGFGGVFWKIPVMHKLLSLKVPFRILWGDEDEILPVAHADFFCKIAGDGFLHRVGGASHVGVVRGDDGQAMADTILSMLQSPKRVDVSTRLIRYVQASKLMANPESFKCPFIISRARKMIKTSLEAFLAEFGSIVDSEIDIAM
jgi:pimeloyl-ACP methyl ester carboxylesterase